MVSDQPFAAGQWHHVGFTISDALSLYIDGKATGEARNVVLPAGSVTLGGRFKGEMDEAQVSGLVRLAEWIAVQAALGPDGKLVVMGEEETIEGDSDASHMSIILKSLTVDGWVAIGLLTVMLLMKRIS